MTKTESTKEKKKEIIRMHVKEEDNEEKYENIKYKKKKKRYHLREGVF